MTFHSALLYLSFPFYDFFIGVEYRCCAATLPLSQGPTDALMVNATGLGRNCAQVQEVLSCFFFDHVYCITDAKQSCLG